MTADDRTALALAAMRITKGNPTAQDVAALAVLLASRLRHEAQAPPAQAPQAEGRVEKLPLRPRPSFTAPGAWAS
ncbi:acyl-CoA carboxylase epsilon subunit [Streptomyces sp. XY332]|uniref:acyl-CoA carboxylase epsilon subunit n=1 Tax=Streptomyces sp. XY332 TaxID=1415561 RepID=UPI0006B1D35F|nr:acyl-CoA carboxylase epsilon subunit [Streptomyces sp. XY332]KOY54645.1 hypothetical protein ADK59_28880 [Streptomyces sp. XY332]